MRWPTPSSAATSRTSRRSWATCCCRWCSTRAWPRSRARSPSRTSPPPSPTRWSAAIRMCSATTSYADRAEQSEGLGGDQGRRAPRQGRAESLLDDVPMGLPALTRAVQAGQARRPRGLRLATVAGRPEQARTRRPPSWRPRSTPATWRRRATSWATCCSWSPTSPAPSTSSPRTRCAAPTPSSPAASASSRPSSPSAARPPTVRPRRDGRPLGRGEGRGAGPATRRRPPLREDSRAVLALDSPRD